MKIFISCPFSGIMDWDKKEIKKEYKYFFNELINYMESQKIDYYLAIKRENMGKDYVSPKESTLSDYNWVKNCDVLFVIPGNPISGGVHIELGWASSMKKKIHLFLEKEAHYSPVLNGLSALTETIYHKTEKFPSQTLLDCIINAIKEETNRKE